MDLCPGRHIPSWPSRRAACRHYIQYPQYILCLFAWQALPPDAHDGLGWPVNAMQDVHCAESTLSVIHVRQVAIIRMWDRNADQEDTVPSPHQFQAAQIRRTVAVPPTKQPVPWPMNRLCTAAHSKHNPTSSVKPMNAYFLEDTVWNSMRRTWTRPDGGITLIH